MTTKVSCSPYETKNQIPQKRNLVFGPSGETRTRGILLPKQARYQLRYTWLSCDEGYYTHLSFKKQPQNSKKNLHASPFFLFFLSRCFAVLPFVHRSFFFSRPELAVEGTQNADGQILQHFCFFRAIMATLEVNR